MPVDNIMISTALFSIWQQSKKNSVKHIVTQALLTLNIIDSCCTWLSAMLNHRITESLRLEEISQIKTITQGTEAQCYVHSCTLLGYGGMSCNNNDKPTTERRMKIYFFQE